VHDIVSTVFGQDVMDRHFLLYVM